MSIGMTERLCYMLNTVRHVLCSLTQCQGRDCAAVEHSQHKREAGCTYRLISGCIERVESMFASLFLRVHLSARVH